MENKKFTELYYNIKTINSSKDIEITVKKFVEEKVMKNAEFFVEFMKKAILDIGLSEVQKILTDIQFNLKMNRLNVKEENIFKTFIPIYPSKFFYNNSMPLIIKSNKKQKYEEINDYIGVTNNKIQKYQLLEFQGNQYIINNQISIGSNTKKANDLKDFVNFIFEMNRRSTKVNNSKINEKHYVEKKEYVVKKLKNFKEVEYEYSRNQYIVDEYKKNINDESACKLCNEKYDSKIVDGLTVYNLHVHHIIPLSWENDFEKRWNNLDQYDNLIDLCPSCHSKIHFYDDEKKLIDIDKLIKYGINPDKLKQK